MATLQHAIERGQVLAVLDSVLGPLENLLDRDLRQSIKPQPLDLNQLCFIGVSGVILVVIIQAEQGKDLIKCLDMTLCCRPGRFTWPRRCL